MCQKESWGPIVSTKEAHSTQRANHRECTGLGCGGTIKWNKE